MALTASAGSKYQLLLLMIAWARLLILTRDDDHSTEPICMSYAESCSCVSGGPGGSVSAVVLLRYHSASCLAILLRLLPPSPFATTAPLLSLASTHEIIFPSPSATLKMLLMFLRAWYSTPASVSPHISGYVSMTTVIASPSGKHPVTLVLLTSSKPLNLPHEGETPPDNCLLLRRFIVMLLCKDPVPQESGRDPLMLIGSAFNTLDVVILAQDAGIDPDSALSQSSSCSTICQEPHAQGKEPLIWQPPKDSTLNVGGACTDKSFGKVLAVTFLLSYIVTRTTGNLRQRFNLGK